jgi:hypothetical protein
MTKKGKLNVSFILQKLSWKINVLITMREVNITKNDNYFTPAVQKHNDYIMKVSLSVSRTHLPMPTPTNYVPFREGKRNYKLIPV